MSTLTKPLAKSDGDAVTAAEWNAVMNAIYDTFGSAIGSPGGGTGEGLIDDDKVKTGANINKAKTADTAVVCGNAFNPGTQTITRTTVFQGEGIAANTMGSANTPTTYDGGTFYTETGATNSAGNGSTLKTKDLPANTLTTTGRGIRIRAWGTATNTASARTVSLRWGGQTLVTKILQVSVANEMWVIEAVILRTGANTQNCVAEAKQFSTTAGALTINPADGAGVFNQLATLAGTQTETAAITIKCVADTVNAAELQQTGLVIEFI